MSATLASAVVLATLAFPVSSFADELYRTEYRISVLALPIARSTIETRVSNGTYQLNGSFSSSGVARIFENTDGTISVTGKSVNQTAVPASYDLRYTHGKKSKSTLMRFNNGTVTSAVNTPPVKKRDPWVEVGPNDLRSVADPLSAMMIQAKTPQEVCSRRLQIFDGQTRADIQLSYSGTESVSTTGFSGEAVVCSVKFVPISGFQKGKQAIDYLANRSKISISFAPLGNSGIYAPVIARIGTQIGTVKVSATRFEKVQ